MKSRKVNLASLLAFKASIADVLAVALVLTLGINFISTGVMGFFELSHTQNLIIGVLLILIGVLTLIKSMKPEKNGTFTYRGATLFDRKSKRLMGVRGYDSSEEITSYVEAICNENKALKKIWEDDPIGHGYRYENGNNFRKIPKANQLFNEALEYYALNTLSLHLNSYFIKTLSLSDKKLESLERHNMPSVLLQNRFLEMFSKPMEEREAFLSHGTGGSSHGTIVSAFGTNGAIYDRFELTLPKGSTVIRESNSSVSIKTKRFCLNLHTSFDGTSTVFGRDFEKYYLGADPRSLATFSTKLTITVSFSNLMLLSRDGWDYYWWIDSFLDKVEKNFSKESFLAQISWEGNRALLHMMNTQRCSDSIHKNEQGVN